MAPLPTLPPDPTQPFGSAATGAIKKGSNVFRPGANVQVTSPNILSGAGMGSPYGPIQAGTTTRTVGQAFKALYAGTDEEVGQILSGVDDAAGTGEPLSASFRRGLKDILLAGRYLSKSDYVPSAEFGNADYAAMREFLQEANYLGGYNWREALGIVTDRIASKGTGTGSSTYTQYSISNEQDAEIIVDAALSNFLGRGATRDEKANLSRALRKYEQGTPTVTTTTQGAGGSVSTTTSGVSAEGRQQAILGGFSESQRREMSGVVNTQLGDLFSSMLRNA
jgi:hypothetical protein